MTTLYKSILIGFALTSVLFSGYFLSRFFGKECYYGDVTGKIYCGGDYEKPFHYPLINPNENRTI